MLNFKSISIVCGPGEVRYGITTDGQLFVWVGDMVETAPPGSQSATIEEGFYTWTISDVPPDVDDESIDPASVDVTYFGAEA